MNFCINLVFDKLFIQLSNSWGLLFVLTPISEKQEKQQQSRRFQSIFRTLLWETFVLTDSNTIQVKRQNTSLEQSCHTEFSHDMIKTSIWRFSRLLVSNDFRLKSNVSLRLLWNYLPHCLDLIFNHFVFKTVSILTAQCCSSCMQSCKTMRCRLVRSISVFTLLVCHAVTMHIYSLSEEFATWKLLLISL